MIELIIGRFKMNEIKLALLYFLLMRIPCMLSKMSLTPDGGYRGIVVKIADNVAEERCDNIIDNLKVRQDYLILSTL